MVNIRHERPAEEAAREALLDASYGLVRFTKTSERLRAGRPELSLVALEGRRLVGSVRLWRVTAGSGWSALLLGPLAVHPDCRKRGIGATLMRHALREAERLDYGAVLLVGDARYYARFGFSSERTRALLLPGPYEQHRLLAHELVPGALDGAHGQISSSSRPDTPAGLAAGFAGLDRNDPILAPHAA